MNDPNQSFEPQDRRTPWDDGTYRTGTTKPPKSHSGLIAFLLIAVIVLCGVVSVLSLMNIRLFRQAGMKNNQEGGGAVHFSPTNASTDATLPGDDGPQTDKPYCYSEDIKLELNGSPSSVDNVPQTGGLSLQEIYTKAIDSVVSITCRSKYGNTSGTGVVVSEKGYLVTNAHVVENAASIGVRFTDGSELDAALVGADTVSDLAVLYVDAAGLACAEFGDSSALRVGDAVVAIGDPLGAELRGTMTDGIVSAINRDVTTNGRTMTLIQTNAALNAGNSGGPLINCYGQVIGINTMKIGDYMSSAGVEGLGFAIPSTTVKEVVDQLIRQGYVSGRPTLGVRTEEVPTFYQMYYGLPSGLFITQITADSFAEKAGLREGDVIVSIDNTRVTDADTLNAVLYAHKVGDAVDLVVYRSGRSFELNLTLDESGK